MAEKIREGLRGVKKPSVFPHKKSLSAALALLSDPGNAGTGLKSDWFQA